MFQDSDALGGSGLGITNGTQPVAVAPALEPGVHLRWASAPRRGYPRHGSYVFRRKHGDGITKPVSIQSDTGQSLIDSTSAEFGRTRLAAATETGDGGTDWVEFTFTDRSYITRIDILVSAGTTSGFTVTARTGTGDVDTATVVAGTMARQTVSVTGMYIETLRLEGDLGLVTDLRLYSQRDTLAHGWADLPGVDQPVALPLASDDHPATTAPGTLAAARTMAADRIQYGPATRFTATEPPSTTAGTVSVTVGSPIVVGANTDWGDELAGETFQLDGDSDAYTVLSVLDSDRVVLSRAYVGSDASGMAYAIGPDRFASIHDSLATLVADGPDEGGMSARAVPTTIESAGTVERAAGSATVTGVNTAWDASHEGLDLQVAAETAGTVTVEHGSTTVTGMGTDWTTALEDAVFVVDDQRTRYTITTVSNTTTLELDRPYDGPDHPTASGGRTYQVFERARTRIERVVSTTELELAQPHAGETDDTGRQYRLIAGLGPQSHVEGASMQIPAQYPYELLNVGSIDPAMSQLLGQYIVDDTVQPEVAYDYLVVTDDTGIVDMIRTYWASLDDDQITFADLIDVLIGLAEADYVDAVLVQGLEQPAQDPAPPAAPTGTAVYELPESTATGTSRDRYAAGVTWQRPHVDGRLPAGAPAAYYLWRDPLGESPGTIAPPSTRYDPVGLDDSAADFLEAVDPVLVVPPGDAGTVPGWPTEPIHVVDGRRPPGWYSYRVNGVDLFGRHTPLSDPAIWREADTNAPATHDAYPSAPSFAVELDSRLPPPPPKGVAAAVLDPDDPATDGDQAAVDWWATNGEQVALRIGWQWPASCDAQAPDTDGFECYVDHGSLNSHPGTVTAVNQGRDVTRLTTTLSHTTDPTDSSTTALLAGAFAGGSVHVAGAQFTIVDSGGGSGLWVDVQNREGSDGPVVPTAGVECAISIPAVYSRGTATVVDGDTVVTGADTAWTQALAGQTIRFQTTLETYEVDAVDSPTRLQLREPYAAPPTRDARVATAYAIDHPVSIDYTDPLNWDVAVADVAKVADIADRRTPAGDRFYEVIVPAPGADDGAFDPGVGPGESPVVHANVGVCARIDRADGPDRSAIGGPAPITRVHRDPPAPPAVPPLPSTIDWATRPDYDATAHYTVRWQQPSSGLKAHVYRALDRTLFRTDWQRRQTPGPDGDPPHVLEASQTQYFPPALRSNGAAETQRRDEITATLTQSVLDGDDFASATAVYDDLAPDAIQTLAAIPGNDAAFTQRTTDPLAAADAPNVRGPDYESGDPGPGTQPGVDDVPDTMPPGDTLCAYVDGFDGRSRNRYLYRVATVDAAHNRGTELGYPTPPTQARDGVAPESPRVGTIAAGHPVEAESDDRRLTLTWTPVQSPDLHAYRVYRTTEADAVRDVRLMDEVAELSIPIPAPADGDPLTTGIRDGPTVTWTDDDRAPGVDWHYRIVAVDTTGNTSAASTPVAGRTFDTSPPTPPAITNVEWVRVGPDGTIQPYTDPVPAGGIWQPVVQVEWEDPGETRVMVELAHGAADGDFLSVSSWLEQRTTCQTDTPEPTETYRFQLRALDERGRDATSSTPITLTPPGGA